MTGKKKMEKPEEGAAPAAGVNFEKSIERLEKIVADMEGGSLSLEAMIERFEEGQRLIRDCSRALNEVEKKVEILVRKGDEVVAEPLDEEEDAGDDEVPEADKEEINF